MEHRNFGTSDLRVSAIGFGCWPMGGTRYGPVDDEEEIAAVHRALELGVTCFDTAADYGQGHSEEVLGRALGPRRKDVVVVSTCGVPLNKETGQIECDSSRQHILEAIDESLSRLGTDYLDLFLLHRPDPDTPIEESMQALGDLIDAGKIRYAGGSNYRVDRLAEARQSLGIVTDQVGYHLFDRRIEHEIVPFCKREGVGIMAYGSLAHGILTGALTPDTEFEADDWRSSGNAFGLPLFAKGHFERNLETADKLKAVAARAGRSLVQLATAWVLRDPVVTVALVGFRRASEVEGIVGAAEWTCSPDELDEIDSISRPAFERLYAARDLDPAASPLG